MFEKKYKVKDLHIIWLGKVKKLNKGELQLNSIENPYVIVKDYHHYHTKSWENCKDVFNNT